MQIQHIGYRIRGFIPGSRIRASFWGMLTQDTQQRLKTLGFWSKHGARVACEAFGVSCRTLYRRRKTLRKSNGRPAALAPQSNASKRRRRPMWPNSLAHEIRRAAHALRLLNHFTPTTVRYVLSGNGSEFMKDSESQLQQQQTAHWWTYPKCPKMNAHYERFNRTIQESFIDYHEDLLFTDVNAFNRAMTEWLVFYNAERPRRSLSLLSPVQ